MCFLLLFRLELFELCSTHGKWQESQSVNKNRHCLLRSWFGTDSLSFHHVALAQTSHMAEWEISKARKFHFGRWFCKVTWSKSWLYNLNPGRLWRTTNNHFPYLPGVWSLPLVLSCCETWEEMVSLSQSSGNRRSQISSISLILEFVRFAHSHARPRLTESETKPQWK